MFHVHIHTQLSPLIGVYWHKSCLPRGLCVCRCLCMDTQRDLYTSVFICGSVCDIHTGIYFKAGDKCYLNKTFSHFLAALLHVLERFLLPDSARGL